jgi:hypothetical protein
LVATSTLVAKLNTTCFVRSYEWKADSRNIDNKNVRDLEEACPETFKVEASSEQSNYSIEGLYL